MTEPTDDELDMLIDDVAGLDSSNEAFRNFARAVLAKWGTPVPVGVEPVAVFKFERGTPGRQNEMPRVVSCNWMADGEYEVYPTSQPTQPQAGAITPPPIECNTEELKRAYAFGWWSALEKQRETAQAGAVPQYRLLHSGVDRIEDDDEFLSDDTTTWAIDPNGIFSGNIYGGHVLRPARRRIKGGQHGTNT